jgi:hypothetical protein
MDGHRFDRLTRALTRTASRRSLVAMALVTAPGWLTPLESGAKTTGKDKPKRPKPNQYGCLAVGARCKRASQCCSSRCNGKPGKKTCRAHGTGTCKQGGPGLCQVPADEIPLVTCNNIPTCLCARTTAGSNYCFNNAADVEPCTDCRDDADCEALGYPRGSACAPVSTGICTGVCQSGMACLVPCGYEPPAPERSRTRSHTPFIRMPGARRRAEEGSPL